MFLQRQRHVATNVSGTGSEDEDALRAKEEAAHVADEISEVFRTKDCGGTGKNKADKKNDPVVRYVLIFAAVAFALLFVPLPGKVRQPSSPIATTNIPKTDAHQHRLKLMVSDCTERLHQCQSKLLACSRHGRCKQKIVSACQKLMDICRSVNSVVTGHDNTDLSASFNQLQDSLRKHAKLVPEAEEAGAESLTEPDLGGERGHDHRQEELREEESALPGGVGGHDHGQEELQAMESAPPEGIAGHDDRQEHILHPDGNSPQEDASGQGPRPDGHKDEQVGHGSGETGADDHSAETLVGKDAGQPGEQPGKEQAGGEEEGVPGEHAAEPVHDPGKNGEHGDGGAIEAHDNEGIERNDGPAGDMEKAAQEAADEAKREAVGRAVGEDLPAPQGSKPEAVAPDAELQSAGAGGGHEAGGEKQSPNGIAAVQGRASEEATGGSRSAEVSGHKQQVNRRRSLLSGVVAIRGHR